MLMGIYMIYAEAMVACAAGTVAEFQRGMVRVCSAADGALSRIGLLPGFAVDAVPLPAEIDRGLAAVGAVPAEALRNVIPAEQNKVQYGDNRQQIYREWQNHDGSGKKQRIDDCQPLDLNRQNEEQQHDLIGIQNCEREKHGEVDVNCADRDIDMKAQIHHKTIDDRKENTCNII